jgi:diguanylate cyclase (GGDEF)-like protein
MKSRTPAHRHQPETVEIELIRSLFLAFVPSVIMSVSYAAAGMIALARLWDPMLFMLLLVGMTASGARLVVAWRLGPKAANERLSLGEARRLERRFAIPYLSFAVVLGLFGLRAFTLPAVDLHMLTICLLIGYCAGVAVGMGLRLWIAVPAMLISTVPALMVAITSDNPVYWVMSGIVAFLIIGGTHSLFGRRERSIKDIGLRLAFANLARKDALTALPNRVAMHEWYDARLAEDAANSMVAVHYIDLNGFKPVNDSYGHPVGDALLIMVGKRIANTIRESDLVARLGGDEFAVLQYGIKAPEEAEGLAQRLVDAIGRPFRIGERTINISTGLGYVIADGQDEDLEHLLGLADQALYASKRGEGAIIQHDAVESLQQRRVA